MAAAKKGSPPATADPKLAQLAANVDELGDIEKQLAPFEAKRKRAEQLRGAIRAHFADAAADQPLEAQGTRFMVLLGPKANERSIDYAKLWKLAGAKAKSIATVTLKALESAVSCSVFAEVVSEPKPTGSRSLKVYERGTAETPVRAV